MLETDPNDATEVMEDARPITYRLDHCDRLTEWNDAFAEHGESHGLGLEPAKLIGRPIWDFIGESEVARLHRWLLDRARKLETPIRYRYRCLVDGKRRLFEMRMRPAADGSVEYSSVPIAEDSAENRVPESTRLLNVCSWCDRVSDGDEWRQLGSTMLHLDAEDAGSNEVTHGICPSCTEGMSSAPRPRTLTG